MGSEMCIRDRGIYSYIFDFETFKNDTFKSVIFRYVFSEMTNWDHFDSFGENFDFDTFKNGSVAFSRTLQSVKIKRAKIKSANFFIAFLDDLGNFKHFEPYLFFALSIFTLCKVQ